MVTVATKGAPPSASKPESLTHIDIRKLSQSELHALSLCSDAAFDLRCTDDVVTPQIDRNLFNESAGSRRQTYSRPRHPDSSNSAGHRSRLPGLLPNPRPLPTLAPDDPERAENKSIVNFLKQLINRNEIENSPADPLLLPPPPPQQPVVSDNPQTVPQSINRGTEVGSGAQDMQIVVYSGEKKRKRGRQSKPPEVREDGGEIRLEIVNKNGVAVDLKALENADELYAAELRTRTAGLETEEGVLGVLRNLEGQWGSRRKKRKIVDAGEFGDSMPIGWKLLLGLKRREGRVSIYCRRYISPTGQQFESCKEVSSYLQSYFGLNDGSQQLNQMEGNNQQFVPIRILCNNPSEVQQNACFAHKNVGVKQDSVPSSSIPNGHEMELSLIGIDNLPEVQVRDLFECYKCNMTFDEKNTYLTHLMSFHQRTTRRYRLGSSIGEGVIIKDGKYECQICHKVFHERRSYNGHVGIHIRNHVRSSEELPGQATIQKSTESPSQDGLPQRTSKMDALIEIAQTSILENSAAEPNDKAKANDGSSPHTIKVIELSLGSDPNDLELEDCMTKSIPGQGFNQHYGTCIVSGKEKGTTDHISYVKNNLTGVCTDTLEHRKLNKVEKHGNSQPTPSHDVLRWTSHQTVKENVHHSVIVDFSIPSVQSLQCFPSSTANPNKGENECCGVDPKLDNITGFDELRLEEMETLKFSFVNGQESPALPEVSTNLANDEGMEVGFNSPARFDSEAVVLNIAGGRQFTTVCVWCRTEFNHEAVDTETQSDSVGFMCSACKAKISGQLNVLDSRLSMNFQL